MSLSLLKSSVFHGKSPLSLSELSVAVRLTLFYPHSVKKALQSSHFDKNDLDVLRKYTYQMPGPQHLQGLDHSSSSSSSALSKYADLKAFVATLN
jgi:hypothetical protein